MTILEEIEEKVALLSRQEFLELVRRLREQHNDEWDKQIEEDVAAGRSNFLLEEVDEEIAAGRTKLLDEICGDSQILRGVRSAPAASSGSGTKELPALET